MPIACSSYLIELNEFGQNRYLIKKHLEAFIT